MNQAARWMTTLSGRPFSGRLLLTVVALLAALLATVELVERFAFAGDRISAAVELLPILRGLGISAILAGAVLRAYRGQLFAGPSATGTEALRAVPLDRQERRGQYALWFIQLRWLAAAVVLGLVTIVSDRALVPLLGWWIALVACNLLFSRWLQRDRRYERQIVAQAAADLVILTGLLNASGGLENPLYMIYLLHVILAVILLPRRQAVAVTALAIMLFAFLAFGEFLHILPHYTNPIFPHPEEMGSSHGTATEAHRHGDSGHASHDLLFVLGRSLPFAAVLIVTAFFTAMIIGRLRRSEAHLGAAADQAMLDRRQLESVVHASGVGMLEISPDLEIRWFSQRVGQWFGWDSDTVGSRCPLLAAATGCSNCVVASAASGRGPLELERREDPPEGGQRYFRHSASAVRDHEGEVVQIVEVIEDVTARKALQAETIRASKLSVLGRMAAGIAHEIGNPLSSIATRLSLLEKRPQRDFVADSVAVLRTQIERIHRIVRGVSHFARAGRERATVWEVNPLLEEAIRIVELDRRSTHARFVSDLETPSPRVRGVRDHIAQVVLNLLLNAVEAMPEEGTVRVASFCRDGRAALTVADDGRGIAAADREHLFEPFFTTKRRGTGLGLSISQSLVEAHGGRIEVDSEPGSGARFLVHLPLAPEDDGR